MRNREARPERTQKIGPQAVSAERRDALDPPRVDAPWQLRRRAGAPRLWLDPALAAAAALVTSTAVVRALRVLLIGALAALCSAAMLAAVVRKTELFVAILIGRKELGLVRLASVLARPSGTAKRTRRQGQSGQDERSATPGVPAHAAMLTKNAETAHACTHLRATRCRYR